MLYAPKRGMVAGGGAIGIYGRREVEVIRTYGVGEDLRQGHAAGHRAAGMQIHVGSTDVVPGDHVHVQYPADVLVLHHLGVRVTA